MPAEAFLLFDVAEHEQINKQRRALMLFLYLAQAINRTLVLPRTRLHDPHKTAPHQYVRWSTMLNVSAIALEKHRTIELDDYLLARPQGALIDTLVLTPSPSCTPAETRTAFAFSGEKLRFGRVRCASNLEHDHVALRNMQDVNSIAFGSVLSQLSPHVALALRPAVRFVRSVYDDAAALVRRRFRGEPFLAIHWRRTDFLVARSTQPGVLQSAADVIAHAHRAMQARRIERVYLATDSTDEREVQQVVDALGAVRHGDVASDLVDRARLANVEIAICAMADFFLGTRTSSFTLAIMEERRAIFMRAPDSASEMGDTPRSEPRLKRSRPSDAKREEL